MSMSQANASLLINVAAETSSLGVTLTQAEQIVANSTSRMGRKVDDAVGKLGTSITKQLMGAFGAGFIISSVDTAIRNIAESIRNNNDIGQAVGDGLMAAIKGLPIVGALVDAFEPAMEALGAELVNATVETYQLADRITTSNVGMEELRAQERRMLEGELAILQGRRAQESDPVTRALGGLTQTGIREADTALGTFRFGLGSAGDVSRNLYDTAQEQVDTLKRIEELQKEIRDKFGATN